MHTQLNTMFRTANKAIYEVEGNINDIYYGKPVKVAQSQSSDFMSHSFGYGQPQQRNIHNRRQN